MKNLLIITQKVDENADLLGFFVGWIREFAEHFNRVDVITLAKGQYSLPENAHIHSLGKESGKSKISRFFTFYFLLFNYLPGSSFIFAHMSPIFAIASWPAAFLFRKKIVLWYLHRSVTLRLKLAEKMCYKIATSTKESLNIKSKKIVEVGHGIDTEKFRSIGPISPISPTPNKLLRNLTGQVGSIRILSVGRISEIKDYETLIRAAAILKEKSSEFSASGGPAVGWKVKIVGRPVMPPDFDYFEKLKKLVEEMRHYLYYYLQYVPLK